MDLFKDYITENKNTHMTHIEDKVIYGGVNGTRQAINALRELRDVLGGKGNLNYPRRWDGAPAIFCGTDPSDGKFFVAKKGIFNKNAKVYKTNADIDADTKGDLNAKLKDALKYLPDLGIDGVIQGDFLFGKGDLSKQTIEGKKYITFHPNTIVYAVPVEQAKEITSAKIGIVWHTTYTGKTFETMKASYGVNVKNMKRSKNVWSQDAMLRSVDATLTEKETGEINEYLSKIGKLFNQISGSTLRTLEREGGIQTIETYNNTFVRKGQVIGNEKRHVQGLIKYVKDKYQKEIDSRKTEKGKSTQKGKRDEILKFFSPKTKHL